MGELAPKVLVDERYELVERLVDCGCGEAWKAKDPNFKSRQSLLKFLRALEGGDGSLPVELEGLVQSLRTIKHPNVLGVTALRLWEGRPLLVQPLFEGASLSAALRDARESGKAPELARIEKLFEQVAGAVDAAHREGVIHGGLNPGCVLVKRVSNGDFEARVVDFGLAPFAEGGTAGMYNTFAAPERAAGVQPTRTGDVFALGMILRALVADVRARSDGTSAVEYEAREDLPAAVWAVIERARSHDPHARYGTVEALMEALRPAWRSPKRVERTVRKEEPKQKAEPVLESPVQREADDATVQSEFAPAAHEEPVALVIPGVDPRVLKAAVRGTAWDTAVLQQRVVVDEEALPTTRVEPAKEPRAGEVAGGDERDDATSRTEEALRSAPPTQLVETLWGAGDEATTRQEKDSARRAEPVKVVETLSLRDEDAETVEVKRARPTSEVKGRPVWLWAVVALVVVGAALAVLVETSR